MFSIFQKKFQVKVRKCSTLSNIRFDLPGQVMLDSAHLSQQHRFDAELSFIQQVFIIFPVAAINSHWERL